MAANGLFVFFTAALMVQGISAQCIGNTLAAEELALANNGLAYAPGLAANSLAANGLAVNGYAANGLAYGVPYGIYGGLAANYGLNGFAPTSGGGFAVTSSSPIAPTGVTVFSDNAIEGAVSVIGELPFLSAVALEGALPTAGAGGINYGCGNGAIGIVSEAVAPAYGPGIAPAALATGRLGYGAGFGPAGYGAAGLAGPGLAGPGFGYNGLAGGCGYGTLY